MNLLGILIATLVAGVGSVWLAALVLRLATRGPKLIADRRYLLSLAAGALLATAFMHLLPEAFESGARPAALFAVLLGGLVVFFLLDKVELWHHGHEHAHPHAHGDAHDHGHHHHGHAHATRRGGAWAVLAGDSLHCFGDGIVIAAAFTADPALGVVAALAVLAHEVPHHIGDLVVLDAAERAPQAALVKLSLAGLVTSLGGLMGWWLTGQLAEWLPYFLVAAGSSFVYVALADLIPQLQVRMTKRQTAAQVAWLVVGIAVVTVVSQLAHGEHDHGHAGHAHGAAQGTDAHDDHGHDKDHDHAHTSAPAFK
ncbi:ZIP family metal transporter [Pseudorhodoferax sp. Leaf267]|uniref:ZIP family metal transporter n=1 Tax=Pseudorhodoferax sp. Leaf267 TaxID=1736316 RepID=UPI0006F606B7|nr:ZIP family metal transporter [Pseudorhodoferax sp. Leaf267]KQP18040.1 dihydroorotate dehydrogenase [Pseudorhodoferax sp. Leaf267]